MTCIVGFLDKKNGRTYIGADSCGSNASVKRTRVDKKLFKLKDDLDALLGFTSSFRMGQLLMFAEGLTQYEDYIDKDSENEECSEECDCKTELETQMIKIENMDLEQMVTTFVPNVANVLLDGGFATQNGEGLEGGVFMFAHKDKLYRIDCDFQVEETEESYNACGSGEPYALGALNAIADNEDIDIVEKIHIALQAAAKFNPHVEGPFYIMNTANDEVIKFDN